MTERSVLIVEDEPLIAMDVEMEMRDRGWTVVGPYGSLVDAAEAVSNTRVDCAILDINVSSGTSYGLASSLKNKGLFVVFLSGSNGEDRPDDLKDIPVISKPIDYDRLHCVLVDRRLSA